jgi:hypothetical protein
VSNPRPGHIPKWVVSQVRDGLLRPWLLPAAAALLIQALERTQPIRRVWLARAEQRTHDYTPPWHHHVVRGTGRRDRAHHQPMRWPPPSAGIPGIPQAGRPRVPAPPAAPVCNSYTTQRHHAAPARLASHPRIRLHFTPTSASWLNLVEVFFSIVERQALRRGDYASGTDLIAAISRFCAARNERCQPFPGPSQPTKSSPSSTVKPPERRSTRRKSGTS